MRIILIVTLLYTGSCYAQIAKLDLNQLIKQSVANNNRIKSSSLAVLEAKNEIIVAKTNLFLPNIALNTNYGFNWGTSFNLVTNERGIISSTNSSYSINAQLPIYANGQKAISVSKGINNVSITESNLLDEKFEYSKSIISNYYKYFEYKHIVEALSVIKETSSTQYKNSQYKYSIGAISKEDLLLSGSSILEDDVRLNSYQNNFSQVSIFLKNQLGLSLKDSLNLIEDTTISPLSDAEGNLVKTFIENNYKVKAQNSVLKNLYLDKKLARNSAFPQLSFNTGTSTRFDSRSNFNLGPFDAQLRNNLGYFFNFALTYNFANLYTLNLTTKRASLEIGRQQATISDLKQQQSLEINSLLLDIESMAKSEAYLSSIFENYSKVYKGCLDKLKYGKISQIDYLQIKSRYNDIFINFLTARYDYLAKTRLLQNYLAILN
jgi:outer membrane protein